MTTPISAETALSALRTVLAYTEEQLALVRDQNAALAYSLEQARVESDKLSTKLHEAQKSRVDAERALEHERAGIALMRALERAEEESRPSPLEEVP